ncbi:hypothetical protein ACE38W_11150 [Chitinophaga sp. Hz27]|uniref:hypothetical protein n=1 Tax=Chitinophaga sp. Hz27 TaxID=3347169 RepID=UPI0035D5E2FC
MKRVVLSLLLAMGLLTAYAQNNNPSVESSANAPSIERKIKKLLILSAGPMSSRKIAQDVKYALDKEFKGMEFSSSFIHMGDLSYCTDENIQIASKMYPHDAILVIRPELVTDSTKDYVRRSLAYNLLLRDYSRPLKKKRTEEYSTQLSSFFLYDGATPPAPFWSAQLEVNTNLRSESYYDHLVRTLKDTWEAEKIRIGI